MHNNYCVWRCAKNFIVGFNILSSIFRIRRGTPNLLRRCELPPFPWPTTSFPDQAIGLIQVPATVKRYKPLVRPNCPKSLMALRGVVTVFYCTITWQSQLSWLKVSVLGLGSEQLLISFIIQSGIIPSLSYWVNRVFCD